MTKTIKTNKKVTPLMEVNRVIKEELKRQRTTI